MIFLKKYLFLLLAFLALGLSAACYFMANQGSISASDERYLKTVQHRVQQELTQSTEELQQISQQLQQSRDYSFANCEIPTVHPYFIFRHQRLIYWSDHRFIPEVDCLESSSYPYFVSLQQGQFLVNRLRLPGDSIEVFSLVSIYRSYQNENNYLRSTYNPGLFPQAPKQVAAGRSQEPLQNIYAANQVFLFSVSPPEQAAYYAQTAPINTVILGLVSVFMLGLFLISTIRQLQKRRNRELGFMLLLGYLALLRAVMLYFKVPFLLIESAIFKPIFYTSSQVAPSLGDLLLNAICVGILALYLAVSIHRFKLYAWLLHQPEWSKGLVSILLVVLSYFLFYSCFVELSQIYAQSNFTLDITLSITVTSLKITCLLIFVAISTIYFLVLHVLSLLFIRLNKRILPGIGWLVIGSLLAGMFLWLCGFRPDWILILNGLYYLILYRSRFPRVLFAFRYKTSTYLLLGAFICAILSTYVVYKQETLKDVSNKQEFGQQLLSENDELGEFMLQKTQQAIQEDNSIQQTLLTDTLLGRERIQQRVKSAHLDKYFDRYDVEVLSFNAEGLPLDNRQFAPEYLYYQDNYRRPLYKTQYTDLFFINDVNNRFTKQYICFIDIKRGSRPLGHVVLDLKMRKDRLKSSSLDQLAERQFVQAPETSAYSYAVFNKQQHVVSSVGSYNYERRMPTELLETSALYEDGVSHHGYKHIAQRGKNGRLIVVSSLAYPLKNILANFSFQYLTLVLYVLGIILAYAIRHSLSNYRLNYSTKTQILLNLAFFLPLLLIVVITLSAISSNFDANQQNTYINNTKNIASNFLPYIENFLAGKSSKAYMEQEMRKIARGSEIDINLFKPNGQLWTSSQPLLYESGHLSKYINPKAYRHLIDDKENQVLLMESLGTKKYRTAYVSIKSTDRKLLGVLGVPHFDSQAELDRQLIEVISTVLSVFTGLLLVFFFVSYWASTSLTKPLQMITQKIRRTNLDKLNEPLPWGSDDEIGVLIAEYNKMLLKLEENKRALSHSEKQSAWREMAKQVAHEIKNPLTPMKLTLQHLQRTLPKDSQEGRGGIQRTLNSLLDQIDNLSDIATSFSDFAKMPLPKNELFEITTVINKAADLYADDGKISLERSIAPHPVMIVGDRQLIGRILTNLIINGIQSVPIGRKPTIRLKLAVNDGNINIEVSDNGAGIPEAIRTKVFLPNFSTKQGGSGLGLAIAKRGIEHAGGSIWFETVENVGTTFFISIPQTDALSVPPVTNHKRTVKR
ncbi:sensor histidine kinase [Tellurirhabdus bombi]|uniref:sensor histidine kinase n=1 Tax=Tellurirhabdus bombi TaxID=2907205 RepID=UPI001F48E16A|nr:HAMP domain-containing sensor histidine kinase [Tellurirhabdus bombi]